MPIHFLWMHDLVRLGQNGSFGPPEPILTHFYVYISYYPNAFSHVVNIFPKVFESSALQLEASNMILEM